MNASMARRIRCAELPFIYAINRQYAEQRDRRQAAQADWRANVLDVGISWHPTSRRSPALFGGRYRCAMVAPRSSLPSAMWNGTEGSGGVFRSGEILHYTRIDPGLESRSLSKGENRHSIEAQTAHH
jgi:hypothetical protein